MNPRIEAALWRLIRHPQLSLIADVLVRPHFVEVPDSSLYDFASGASWHIYYNPKNIDKLTKDELLVRIAQAIFPLLLNHAKRRGVRKELAWRLASILEVNSMIRRLMSNYVDLDKISMLYPESLGLLESMTAEEYYDVVKDWDLPDVDNGTSSSNTSNDDSKGGSSKKSSSNGSSDSSGDDENKNTASGSVGSLTLSDMQTKDSNKNKKRSTSRSKFRVQREAIESYLDSLKSGNSAAWNNGSGSGNTPGDWEFGSVNSIDNKALSDIEREHLSSRFLDIVNRNPGHFPGGVVRYAAAVFESYTDYREAVLQFIRDSNRVYRSHLVEKGFHRTDRRFTDFILPSELHKSCVLGILCDCSGSMNDDDLNVISSEIEAVFVQTRAVLHIWSHDVVCKYIGVYDYSDDAARGKLKLEGGGGTDVVRSIEFVLAYCKSNLIRLDGLIAFTDTYTDWPNICPWYANFPISIGIIGEGSTPSWVRSFRVVLNRWK